MTTNEHKKHKPERQEFAFGISLGEWIIASIFGLSSGIATAAKTIRDRFMDDLKKSRTYRGRFDRHADELADITLASCNNDSKLLAKTITETKARHQGEVAGWAKEFRGVEDSLIKGTLQRYITHSRRSKNSIIFNGVVGSVVGAAMALSFFNGVATRDRLDDIVNKLDERNSR